MSRPRSIKAAADRSTSTMTRALDGRDRLLSRLRWLGPAGGAMILHALAILALAWLSLRPPTLAAMDTQSTKVTLVGTVPEGSKSVASGNAFESFREKLARPEPVGPPTEQATPTTSLSELLGEDRSQPSSPAARAQRPATGGQGTAAAGAHDDPLARAAYSPPAAKTGPNAQLAMQAARCWSPPPGGQFKASLALDGQGYPTSPPQIRPSGSAGLAPSALQDAIAALTNCSPYPVPHGSGPAIYSFDLG